MKASVSGSSGIRLGGEGGRRDVRMPGWDRSGGSLDAMVLCWSSTSTEATGTRRAHRRRRVSRCGRGQGKAGGDGRLNSKSHHFSLLFFSHSHGMRC